VTFTKINKVENIAESDSSRVKVRSANCFYLSICEKFVY